MVSGKVWTFGDNCDTGQIVPGRYIPVTDSHELAKHAFEDVAPNFVKEVQKGDIVVAGTNFGCGSSREHAPKALKFAGVSAVVAESFARIFYRNALNIGLLAIPVFGIRKETKQGDLLEIDVTRGIVKNCTRNKTFKFVPYDQFIIDMLAEGGITKYTLKMLEKND
ncbi:MAG: 3-isopropylmalate dehydratase small subunit [Peptococcaceae bacterium]|nr:3-isopropylmalate dehydratase small subunit [Peptococcaceae bacterium]